MKFSTPAKAVSTIRSLDWVERQRDANRVPVNREFNGFPPLEKAQAEAFGLDVNINFKESALLAADAISQYKNAFTSSGQFFTVTIENAPGAKKEEYSQFVTDRLKRMMTHPLSHSSRRYLNLWDNKSASIVMHGPGLQQWCGPDAWCPEFVAIEDFRVGTDANTAFDNLSWFAIRRRYTPSEIYDKAFGPRKNSQWKQAPLTRILKAVKDSAFKNCFSDADWQMPTRWMEIIKQDAGYFASDAILDIPVWDLYYENDEGTGWLRRCVADTDTPGEVQNDWLFSSGEKPVASRLSELLHLLPGDLNNKPPLKFHSMRGLMFTLVDPAFWSNLTMCWFLQHTQMNFRPWFRVSDPADKARQQFVDIGDSVNIAEGVTIVPQEQRHQIDPRLFEICQARMRQIMGESASNYTQEIDTGTSKERTAFETNALLTQKNAGLQRILADAYKTENFSNVEICRRATKKNTVDPDCKKFQEECKKKGIDPKFLDVREWNVQPVTTMGQGNDVLELQRAQMLMQVKSQLPPEGQEIALFKYVNAVTKDPAEAQRITRFGESLHVTSSRHDATLSFGALMQGITVEPDSRYNAAQQVEVLLGKMQEFIERTTAIGAMEPEDTLGLGAVAAYIEVQLERIGGDPNEAPRAKAYAEQLKEIMAIVQQLDQQTEQMKAQAAQGAEGNGQMEEMQKLQQNQQKFQQALAQKDVNWQQRAKQREEGFAAKEQQNEQKHQIELRRQAETAAVDRVNDTLSQAKKRMTPKAGA